LQRPDLQHGQNMLFFYDEFVRPFQAHMNPLKGALFATKAAAQCTSDAERTAFFNLRQAELANRKDKDRDVQADVVYRIGLARCQLSGDAASAKAARDMIEACEATLSGMAGIDSAVHSLVYAAHAHYLKTHGSASEFYRMALLYLAYTPIESMSLQEQRAVSFDVGMAALLGDSVYNFGELLAHPAVASLERTENEWLAKLLYAFNRGDLSEYERLVSSYKRQMESQPALMTHAAALKQKIQLMSLVEMVFRRFPGQRQVSFADIAAQTNEAPERVEHLVMKAMSLGLVKGRIDQVSQIVSLTWVQPRVLDKSQIAAVREKIDQWVSKVHETTVFLEQETPELVA
jgi:26S proteasome regulatory subunit N9